jgi:bifunctional non-homologous end joining protein LigD
VAESSSKLGEYERKRDFGRTAEERPTVSTPLEWDEVEAATESGDTDALVFTIDDVRARIAAKDDLFAPLLIRKQELR